MSAVEKATRVLAEDHEAVWDHDVSYYMPLRCRCGVDRPDGAASDETWHAAHQAQALAAAGLLADDPAGEPETCHCGRPVAYGYDGDPTHHRGMCIECDLARCDAHPLDCPYPAQPAAAPSVCDDPLYGSVPHEHHGDAIRLVTAPSEDVEGLRKRLTLVTCAHDDTDMEHVCSGCVLAHIGPLLAAHDAQARADERRTVLGGAADNIPAQVAVSAETRRRIGEWLRGMAEGGDERAAEVERERDSIARLIEASSLGSPEAKAARESVPPEVGRAIALAAKYLARAERAEATLREVRSLADSWETAHGDPPIDPSHISVRHAEALRAALDREGGEPC